MLNKRKKRQIKESFLEQQLSGVGLKHDGNGSQRKADIENRVHDGSNCQNDGGLVGPMEGKDMKRKLKIQNVDDNHYENGFHEGGATEKNLSRVTSKRSSDSYLQKQSSVDVSDQSGTTEYNEVEIAIANIFFHHLDEDNDETLSLKCLGKDEKGENIKCDMDELETEILVNELLNKDFKAKWTTMKEGFKNKKKTFLTVKTFLKEMQDFNQEEVDWLEVEDRLYQAKCGVVCRKTCCCLKNLFKSLRNWFTKGRLKGSQKHQQQLDMDFKNILKLSYKEFMDGLDFWTDAYLGFLCYHAATSHHHAEEGQLKYAFVFTLIIFAIGAPYFVIYSSYMNMVMYKDCYAPQVYKNKNCCGKLSLWLNLTCLGGFYMLFIDFMNKITYAMVLLLRLPPNVIIPVRESILKQSFSLNSQDMKALEAQKQIVVPMFEDLPMLMVQALIYFLNCSYLLEPGQRNKLILSLFMSIFNIVLNLNSLRGQAKRFYEPFSQYSLSCMRAYLGWIPFAENLQKEKIEFNVNYDSFVSRIPWVSTMTGFTTSVNFQFSDQTIETYIHQLVISDRKRNSKGKENVISFYKSVDTVGITFFFSFLENCLYKLNLKDINWSYLIKNDLSRRNIQKKEGESKYTGTTIGGTPLLQVCFQQEPKCKKVEQAPQMHSSENWPLRDGFQYLLETFTPDIDDMLGERTLLEKCRKEKKLWSFKILLANGVDLNRINKLDDTTTFGATLLSYQKNVENLKNPPPPGMPGMPPPEQYMQMVGADVEFAKMIIDMMLNPYRLKKGLDLKYMNSSEIGEMKEVDIYKKQMILEKKISNVKQKLLVSPLYFIIYNQMTEMRQELKDLDLYHLEKVDQAELLELLSLVRSSKIKEEFKNDLKELFSRKDFNFWDIEMKNKENFLHCMFRDAVCITKQQLYEDMRMYKQSNTEKWEEDFKKQIRDLLATRNENNESPLQILIKNLRNISFKKPSDKPNPIVEWIEDWLNILSNGDGDKELTDLIFSEFLRIHQQIQGESNQPTHPVKLSEPTLCQYFKVFTYPKQEYIRIFTKAIQDDEEEAFIKYMKVEEFHKDASKDEQIKKAREAGSEKRNMWGSLAKSITANLDSLTETGQVKRKNQQEKLKSFIVTIPKDLKPKPFDGPLSSEDKHHDHSGNNVTEMVLSFILESLAASDLVSDIWVMIEMLKAKHAAWFAYSYFTMMCPFLMGYGCILGLKISSIRRTLDADKNCFFYVINIGFLTPLVTLYLFFIDLIYLVMSIVLMPIQIILKCCKCKEPEDCVERFMQKVFQTLFQMDKMDVHGFRRQRTILQFTFESIPQLILQLHILRIYWTQVKTEGESRLDIDIQVIVWSVIFATLHMITELIFLKFEANSIFTQLNTYYVVCLNARQGWIPFLDFFKTQTEQEIENVSKITNKKLEELKNRKQKEGQALKIQTTQLLKQKSEDRRSKEACEDYKHPGIIEFENNNSTVCKINFPLDFQFTDETATFLAQKISNLPEKPDLKSTSTWQIFSSQEKHRPKLYIGCSFDNIKIKVLIRLFKLCSNRVNLELTDINLKGILDRDQTYIDNLRDPEKNRTTDFIEVVRIGAHELVQAMIEAGADFSTIWINRMTDELCFGSMDHIEPAFMSLCCRPLELARQKLDFKTMKVLMNQPLQAKNNDNAECINKIYGDLAKLEIDSVFFPDAFNTLAGGSGVFMPHWFRKNFEIKFSELNYTKIAYLDFVQILWALFGPHVPLKFSASSDIQLLDNLQKYQFDQGGSGKEGTDLFFTLTDSSEIADVDSRLLFHFSNMRTLINQNPIKFKLWKTLLSDHILQIIQRSQNEEGYLDDLEEDHHVGHELDGDGEEDDEAHHKCSVTRTLEPTNKSIQIPQSYHCTLTDLSDLQHILYSDREDRGKLLKLTEKTEKRVGELDKVIESIGLDINRDKYFHLSRDAIKSGNKEDAPEKFVLSQPQKKLKITIPDKVLAIKGMKLKIENLMAGVTIKVIHPFCSYSTPIAQKDANAPNYQLTYDYIRKELPNPKFNGTKMAKQMFNSIMNDVRAGDKLEFKFDGKAENEKQHTIEVELEYYKELEMKTE